MSTRSVPPSALRTGAKTGAMTAAMRAHAPHADAPRALRVGVLRGTRMTDERVLRAREPVSLGATERSTFTVADAALPQHLELFSVEGGRYVLRAPDAMRGRVALGDRVFDVDQLPDATRTEAGLSVALPETARGRLQLGDVTVLFQFVTPPPDAPRPQLPASLRARLGQSLDWTYNGCLAFFAAAAITSAAYAELVYDPVVDVDLASDARLVRLLTMPAPDATEPTDTPDATEPTDTAAAAAAPSRAPSSTRPATRSPTPSRDPGPDRADGRIAAAERAADAMTRAATRALANSADFDALTASVTDRGDSARDMLHQGGLMQNTERDLAGLQGVRPGGTAVQRQALAAAGPNGARTLGEPSTVRPAGDAVRTGEVTRERLVAPAIEVGSSDVLREDGDIDAGAVARLVRGQLGGIRSCYERALRNHPTLSGRLDARFTIGTTGRITTIASHGLSEAPEVSTCVNTRLRGLVFPSPEGGAVEFSFPFTFSPGG